MEYLKAELLRVEPGRCDIGLEYRPELSQQHGFFHGGVLGTLADNAAGYAAYTLMEPDATVLTVEYKLNLLEPGLGHRLIAEAEVVKSGRTVTVCRSSVYAEETGRRRLCATALVTLIQLRGKPDGPHPGSEPYSGRNLSAAAGERLRRPGDDS